MFKIVKRTKTQNKTNPKREIRFPKKQNKPKEKKSL